MNIGIYGGTFNPPHLGHLAAARAVIEILKLDLLLFLPASLPPHKELPQNSPTAEQRLEMTRLAAEQLNLDNKIKVLDIELQRGGKSYTSDTMEEIKRMYPTDTLWFLLGTDMFLSFHTWHDPGKILSYTGLAAFSRTEEDMEEAFLQQRERLYRIWSQAKIFTLDIPDVINISSTALREKLAQGQGRDLLPPTVYGYILRHHLYCTHEDLKHISLSRLRPIALSYLAHKRIPHVLGTEQEAIRLALRYGANIEKARRAALLHDCTKKLGMKLQLKLCNKYGIVLDETEKNTVKLLHAKTGAAIARDVFNADQEIHDAIFYHTTGRGNMTLLDKILYLADYIEPSRDFPGVETLREKCYENLDDGLLLGLEMSISEMEERGAIVHHATLEARDALRGKL